MPWVFKNEFGESPAVSDKELQDLAARGAITAKTLVRRDTSSSFVEADQIKGLKFAAAPKIDENFDFVSEAAKPIAPAISISPDPEPPKKKSVVSLVTTLPSYWSNQYLGLLWTLNVIFFLLTNICLIGLSLISVASNIEQAGYPVLVTIVYAIVSFMQLLFCRMVIEVIALVFDMATYLRLMATATVESKT